MFQLIDLVAEYSMPHMHGLESLNEIVHCGVVFAAKHIRHLIKVEHKCWNNITLQRNELKLDVLGLAYTFRPFRAKRPSDVARQFKL